MTPLVFLDRRRRSDSPWVVDWKIRLFVIGAALAVAGIITQIDWLVTSAIVILIIGFALRLLPRGADEETPE
jgi:hypothetical protein